MGSKTISLDDEAYKRLKREKNVNEFFSDVVKRLIRPFKRKSLVDFAGVANYCHQNRPKWPGMDNYQFILSQVTQLSPVAPSSEEF